MNIKNSIYGLMALLMLWNINAFAQQIKRQTLSSVGSVQNGGVLRLTATFGSCPGCSVLNNQSGSSGVYLRQGFQQPPNTDQNENPQNCMITPEFRIDEVIIPTCGTNYNFEYNGNASTQGNSVVSFAWDFGEGANPRTSTQTNPEKVVFATTGIKTVTLRVKQGDCTSSQTQIIEVKQGQVGFAAMTEVTSVKCYGKATGGIKLNVSGGTGSRTFKWSNGATTANLSNVTSGRYSVTVTDISGCTLELDTIQVQQPLLPLVVEKQLKDDSICNLTAKRGDGYIRLAINGGTEPYSVNWSNGKNTLEIDSLVKDTYRLSIFDNNLCALDTFYVISCVNRVVKKNEIVDVITPNGDGKNDDMVIYEKEKYPDMVLHIYNRWGESVYVSEKGYPQNWAGKSITGKDLPAGAYYFLIEYNKDNKPKEAGSITILR